MKKVDVTQLQPGDVFYCALDLTKYPLLVLYNDIDNRMLTYTAFFHLERRDWKYSRGAGNVFWIFDEDVEHSHTNCAGTPHAS